MRKMTRCEVFLYRRAYAHATSSSNNQVWTDDAQVLCVRHPVLDDLLELLSFLLDLLSLLLSFLQG